MVSMHDPPQLFDSAKGSFYSQRDGGVERSRCLRVFVILHLTLVVWDNHGPVARIAAVRDNPLAQGEIILRVKIYIGCYIPYTKKIKN
jgi:hypothetical protein